MRGGNLWWKELYKFNSLHYNICQGPHYLYAHLFHSMETKSVPQPHTSSPLEKQKAFVNIAPVLYLIIFNFKIILFHQLLQNKISSLCFLNAWVDEDFCTPLQIQWSSNLTLKCGPIPIYMCTGALLHFAVSTSHQSQARVLCMTWNCLDF